MLARNITGLELRDYQQEAVDSVFRIWEEEPTSSPLIVVPTGGGKSILVADMCRRFAIEFRKRAMCVIHVKELVGQNYKKFREHWPSADAGIFSASLGRKDRRALVTFANVQSIYRVAETFRNVGLLLIDEAHLLPHSDDGMYRELIRKLRANNPDLKICGLTATPWRLNSGNLCEPYGDQQPLFTEVAYEIPMTELLKRGYLCPMVARKTKQKVDVSGVHKRGGEFIEKELNAAVNTEEINRGIVEETIEVCADRRSWLVFGVSIDHCTRLRDMFRERGVKCEVVSSLTPHHERDRLIRDFIAGRIRCLTNVSILTTGFDYPGLDAIILARPTASPGLFLQMCLDYETEILTPNGWARHGEVSIGDKVAGYDPETGAVKWQAVQDVIDRPLHEGERFYGVKSPHLDIRVTGQHDLLARKRSWKSARLTQAQEVATWTDGYQMPVSGNMRAKGLPLTDAELEFLGWFLADGSRHKATNNVCISQKATSGYCKEIEQTLLACGLRFGKHLVQRAGGEFGQAVAYDPLMQFNISFGDARIKNGTGERGWSRLAPWVDKSIPKTYDDITRDQLKTLLVALNKGDGRKFAYAKDWTPRTMSITCGRNRVMADRIQALCVTRGIRCNISQQDAGNIILMISLDKTEATLRGIRAEEGNPARIKAMPTDIGERVWCVRTPMGTIITRRNGRVAIMGNCGRGLRNADGKANCLMLDFAGNTHRHGLITHVNGIHKKKREGEDTKDCPKCDTINDKKAERCTNCGHVFQKGQAPDQGDREAKLFKSQTTDRVMAAWEEGIEGEVVGAMCKPHVARSTGITTLQVEYTLRPTGGGEPFRVWQHVCIEHEGWANKQARAWWRQRSKSPPPATVAEAMMRLGELKLPKSLLVTRDGQWWRVESAKF